MSSTSYMEETDLPALSREAQEGAVTVVDVRSPAERAGTLGVIERAVNVPLSDIVERRHELPRTSRLVLHCNGGKRGGAACEALLAQGYDHELVRNLGGGLREWVKQELPVVKLASSEEDRLAADAAQHRQCKSRNPFALDTSASHA